MKNQDRKAPALPRMNEVKRSLCAVMIMCILLIALSVANYYYLRPSESVETVDALTGQRIGCCVGWETDYLLSDRDDLTLLRYNTNSDAIMALKYGHVDGIGVEDITYALLENSLSGLDRLPDPIAKIGLTMLCNSSSAENGFLEEFNNFIIEFRESDEYADFCARIRDSSGESEMPDIPRVESDKKLTVGYLESNYPECYPLYEGEDPIGYGAELVYRFAATKGYEVVWKPEGETSAYIDLGSDAVDLVVFNTTDVYRDAADASGYIHMTEAYYYSEVYIATVKEGETLKITGDISEVD